MDMAFLSPLALFTVFNLFLFHGWSEVIYEEGYSVQTVFDGNKLKINPRSAAPLPASHNLLLLDSVNSVFYTLSFPLSEESVLKKFAGNEKPGFSDGDASSAMFNEPRSFAVDYKGNVYVADRKNFAVRKISRSGVTTIAGGYPMKPGRADGPGRNATFSADYELSFVPDLCALLVLDHGSQLIRQINLKPEDCGYSQSAGVRSTSIWAGALVVSCLVGLLIGFMIRPYIKPLGEFNLLNISRSWMSYPTNLGRQTQMHWLGTRSAVASPRLTFLRRVFMLVFSHLSLMFSFGTKGVVSCSSNVHKEHVSLLDSDNLSSSECVSSGRYADQLKDLITFDGDLGSSNMGNDIVKQEDVVNAHNRWQIDDLMLANVANFVVDARKSSELEGLYHGISTAVKRR